MVSQIVSVSNFAFMDEFHALFLEDLCLFPLSPATVYAILGDYKLRVNI